MVIHMEANAVAGRPLNITIMLPKKLSKRNISIWISLIVFIKMGKIWFGNPCEEISLKIKTISKSNDKILAQGWSR